MSFPAMRSQTTRAQTISQPSRLHQYDTLTVTPLGGALGAIVDEIELRSPLSGRTVARINELLAEHQVLFFRDQQLNAGEQLRIARQFGTLTLHPLDAHLGRDRTISNIIDDAANPPAGFDWHTDLSWTQTPPRYGFLYGVDIPTSGGDTLWASLFDVHDKLPPTFRTFCRDLHAIHQIDDALHASIVRHHGADVAARMQDLHPPIAHPLIRFHANQLRPLAYLSPLYINRIAELDRGESDAVLGQLNSLIDDPTSQVRWQWSPGDFVIWDETSTVHRASADHFPARREVRRCTVDRPTGRGINSFVAMEG